MSEQAGEPQRRPGVWRAWTAPAALFGGLLLAAFGALIVLIVVDAFGGHLDASNLPPGVEIADTVVQDFGFVLAAVVLAWLSGRRPSPAQFGLRGTRVVSAIALIGAVYLSFLLFDFVWETALSLHGKEKLLDDLGASRSTALLIGSATLTCVIAPFCEEFLFRGYIFTALRNWQGPWLAALMTGVLFGAVHIGSAPAAYLVPLGFLGFLLCLLYWRTGSLLPCVAAHSINNSIAFGVLENWNAAHITELTVIALAILALLGAILRAVGVIAPASGLRAGAI